MRDEMSRAEATEAEAKQRTPAAVWLSVREDHEPRVEYDREQEMTPRLKTANEQVSNEVFNPKSRLTPTGR